MTRSSSSSFSAKLCLQRCCWVAAISCLSWPRVVVTRHVNGWLFHDALRMLGLIDKLFIFLVYNVHQVTFLAFRNGFPPPLWNRKTISRERKPHHLSLWPPNAVKLLCLQQSHQMNKRPESDARRTSLTHFLHGGTTTQGFLPCILQELQELALIFYSSWGFRAGLNPWNSECRMGMDGVLFHDQTHHVNLSDVYRCLTLTHSSDLAGTSQAGAIICIQHLFWRAQIAAETNETI